MVAVEDAQAPGGEHQQPDAREEDAHQREGLDAGALRGIQGAMRSTNCGASSTPSATSAAVTSASRVPTAAATATASWIGRRRVASRTPG